ncbi:MAG: hypothetical protein JW729_07150, partial [Bacteroidales bacterium]|nr:hypothetical protein [Bacteroidales bacterium]
MKSTKRNLLTAISIPILLLSACERDSKWAGQEPIKRVSTLSKPIQLQVKKTFNLGNDIFCSNEFDGARLNGVSLTYDTLVTVLITPENTPINGSPWYGFKIWSANSKNIQLRLTYLEGVKHRYNPKISKDGIHWKTIDSTQFISNPELDNEQSAYELGFKVSVSPDTLWISAQELQTSKHNRAWMDELATKEYISVQTIGKSKEGKPIEMLKIGNADDSKMILVLSRQHPPEVTGYFAMKAFVEKLSDNSELAQQFRAKYNTYVIPMVNPDGVDHGHWRHNSGGIDLNRDWETFNQPEVLAIKNFMENKVKESKGKFYFGIDFHSTFHDIYYTIDTT